VFNFAGPFKETFMLSWECSLVPTAFYTMGVGVKVPKREADRSVTFSLGI
jgi:hypothetical protein